MMMAMPVMAEIIVMVSVVVSLPLTCKQTEIYLIFVAVHAICLCADLMQVKVAQSDFQRLQQVKDLIGAEESRILLISEFEDPVVVVIFGGGDDGGGTKGGPAPPSS